MSRPLCLLASLLVLACSAEPVPPAPAGGEVATAVTGRVSAPRELAVRVSPSPEPGIPTPFPSPEPSTMDAERAIGGATVQVADAVGTRVPGIPATTTNEDGDFRLEAVPVGYPYVVVATFADMRGRPVRLSALVHTTPTTPKLSVRTATTVVTDAATSGARGLLVTFDAGAYDRAVSAVDRLLQTSSFPDLADGVARRERFAGLEAADPALKEALDRLRPSPSPSP